MEHLLEKIDKKKRQISARLKQLRNRYVSKIYYDIIKGKSFKQIHKDIQTITTIFNNQGLKYTSKMEKYAINLAYKSKKQVDGLIIALNNKNANLTAFKGITIEDIGLTPDVIVATWLFKKFDKEKVYQKTNTISYDTAKQYEAENKDVILKEEIEHNRAMPIPRIFYLCSKHDDCAKDHLMWQGRYYVDENWESQVKNDLIIPKIKKFIRLNDIRTFQWVIGKPVWLITRPNCRHYFKAIDTKEVLEKDIDTVIRNHKMHTKVGKEKPKTIPHPINKEWYTEENIIEIIKKYRDRLHYHEELYKTFKSPTVKRAIEKDKLLIRKWEEYLRKLRMQNGNKDK